MAQRTAPPEIPGFIHLDWIGGGGFADVFRYQDTFGRRVAVKVQHRGVDAGASSAFEAEAKLMAKLSSHPNIVSIFQAGVATDGRPFLVMEECGREHLGARIAKRIQTVSKTMEIIVQIAGAVETAHRMGILHRDIKPANVLFNAVQRPALTDFGISVSHDQVGASNALSPLWAPQEQHPDSNLPMGPWSDVFSLAATMWAMLVGRSPLEVPGGANDRLSLRHRIRTFTPVPTGRHDVPESLERVLATALSRDPGQRYRSALDFARAVQGVQGQINEAVTPIDVLSDDPEEDYEELATEDTGTRVSGFMLIDPEDAEGAGHTVTSSGPTGGVTSPHDHSQPDAGQLGQPLFGPPVAQHGRGYASPGLRDFTGPAVPEQVDHTVLDGAVTRPPQPAAVPQQGKKAWTGALVATAAVVIAGVALGALWWTGALDGQSATLPTASETAAPQGRDPVVVHVPAVEALQGEIQGDLVTFSWDNPDPQDADSYLVTQTSSPVEVPVDSVDEPMVSVPRQPGQTCVEVRLRRGSGSVSMPERGCVQG